MNKYFLHFLPQVINETLVARKLVSDEVSSSIILLSVTKSMLL